MKPVQIEERDFSLVLPEGDWKNHTTAESFDFRSNQREQIMVTLHLPRRSLTDQELLKTVVDLFKARLGILQQHSGNSCQFDSPKSDASPGRMQVMVFAHDVRQKVFIQIGYFGVSQRIVAVSFYDYSGSSNPDSFKQRASALFESIRVT